MLASMGGVSKLRQVPTVRNGLGRLAIALDNPVNERNGHLCGHAQDLLSNSVHLVVSVWMGC